MADYNTNTKKIYKILSQPIILNFYFLYFWAMHKYELVQYNVKTKRPTGK